MLIHAPAKTNLYLSVTDKRPDGYHTIRSLFVHLHGLADSLSIEKNSPGQGLSLTCSSPGLPCDNRNLVWRAADLLRKHLGVAADWHLDLKKKIPVAAGLGGGSSDAAALLHLLPELCGQTVSREDLQILAASLGADVPFFLQKSPAIATGIGDILQPVNPGYPIPIMLINLGFPVSTAWAYRHITPNPGPDIAPLLEAFQTGDVEQLAAHTYNAFEPIVYRKFPILELVRDTAVKNKAYAVRLSGSGATQFALLRDVSTANNIEVALKQRLGFQPWIWSGTIDYRATGRMNEC